MSTKLSNIPERFLPACRCVEQLADYERYQAALIFGSVARKETTTNSDLDVIVLVEDDNSCHNINHPIINSIKLDLSFRSFKQVAEMTEKTIKQRERIPILAESILVFDKTGQLASLQEQARRARPYAITPHDYQFIQFMIYHENDKVARNLKVDPATALLGMHMRLAELLKQHYRIQQRWWVSSKRMLPDLRSWDRPLATLVEKLLITSPIDEKFAAWSSIIDYILAPIGGRQPIDENNCNCEICQQDLGLFQQLQQR
ncbi:nucleotidyltransferase domain-containing protein [Ktedonobacteria bacterium brp13]|nr:nucleotidyltransferase domain-containing protein [Ktedonobacteria bacterium brp13]